MNINERKERKIEKTTELVSVVKDGQNTSTHSQVEYSSNFYEYKGDKRFIRNNNQRNDIDSSNNSLGDIEKDIIQVGGYDNENLGAKNRSGNLFCFWYDHNNSPRICIGPHWPLSLCLLCFLSCVFFAFFYKSWNYLNVVIRDIGVFLALVEYCSFLATALMNPGLVGKNYWLENFDAKRTPVQYYQICRRCRIVVDLNKKVEHCESCDVCVEGNDHHCPWTSKCIGKNNLKCFYMFVVMLFVCIFYGMFAVITVAINETKNLRQQK